MASKKILVADDSLTIQKVIRLALSNEGYEIQAVSDGNDALEQISTWRPDVVLIDVSLPNRSAFEIKRAVNELGDLGSVAFILMSSAFESVDEGQAGEVTFAGRLTKPFDPAHLRQILTQTLGPATVATPTLAPPPPPVPPKMSLPPLPLSPPPPPHSSSETGETDIKRLTESTIKMSGLDDFEWSIQEPSLKPLPNLLDADETAFDMQENRAADSHPEPVFPPAQAYTPPPLPGDEFGFDEPTEATSSAPRLEEPPRAPKSLPNPEFSDERTAFITMAPRQAVPASPSAAPKRPGPAAPVFTPPPPPHAPAAEHTLNESHLDDLVRKHVEKAMEKFARQMLPDVAEKVIKAEIHRLLSEQP